MESSIECVTDGLMDEDEISSQFSSSKSSHTNINTNNLNGMVINPATSVHELLECPVCTNSMYPPIHQVFFLSSIRLLLNIQDILGKWVSRCHRDEFICSKVEPFFLFYSHNLLFCGIVLIATLGWEFLEITCNFGN